MFGINKTAGKSVDELAVDDLLKSSSSARGEGHIWCAGRFEYVEAAPTASDAHVRTAGGVKLYVKAGGTGYPALAFGSLANALAAGVSPLTCDGAVFTEGGVVSRDVRIIGPGILEAPITISGGTLTMVGMRMRGNFALIEANQGWGVDFSYCRFSDFDRFFDYRGPSNLISARMHRCEFENAREGVYFRSKVIGDIAIKECHFADISPPPGQAGGVSVHCIALLPSVKSLNRISISGNTFHNIASPYGKGEIHNECSAVLLSAKAVSPSAVKIERNEIKNVSNADGTNAQGIYTKIRKTIIRDNRLIDAGGLQGSIVVKPSAEGSLVEENHVEISDRQKLAVHGIYSAAPGIQVLNNTLIGVTGFAITLLGNKHSSIYDNRRSQGNRIFRCRGRAAIYASLPDRAALISGNLVEGVTGEFAEAPEGLMPDFSADDTVYGIVISSTGKDNALVMNELAIENEKSGVGIAVTQAQKRLYIARNNVTKASSELYLHPQATLTGVD